MSINSRSSEKIAAAVIFLSVIVLSVVFIYFPRVHSEVSRLLNEGKLQKAAHLVAEAIFNKPEKWKWAIDWCFETMHTIANMTAPSTVKISPNDDETARNQRRAKIQAAVHHKDEVSIKGNTTNAEHVIKSIRFSSYEENNLCNLKEGIPGVEFDATVEEIAKLTNMPIKLKRVVKRARNFTHGDILAVDRLQFTTKNGYMLFGRIDVLRNGDTIDIAYSLHSVTYKLENKQSKTECAGNFMEFSETLNKANDGDDEGDKHDHDGSNAISFDLREDFLLSSISKLLKDL